MQIDDAVLSLAAGVMSSLVTTAVSWGTIKSKVEQLEADISRSVKDHVKIDVFDAHISQLKSDIYDLKKDIKLLLMHTMYKTQPSRDES